MDVSRRQVSVLLDVEPLFSPLTGIGQYTKHLAEGLDRHPSVKALEYTAHGRLLSRSPLVVPGTPPGDTANAKRSLATRAVSLVRPALARSQWAVALYERILPVLSRSSLRRFENTHVLHSPNFILPEFGGRKIVTFHDLSTILMPRFHPPARVAFINRAMERAALSAHHIITDSEFVRAQIISHFSIDPARCTAIPLGANASFRPRDELSCRELLSVHGLKYKRYSLFVSTIEPRKNLLRVLHAHQACIRSGEARFPLMVVGHPGWRSDREHKLLRKMQDAGVAKYIGFVPETELSILFSGARCLLFPSLYEGFGLPVLEAMQSGVAVLTSRQSSMEEVCGDAGVTVNPRSVREIANAWAGLISDDLLVEQLVAAGLQRADAFSWDACVDRTAMIYQALSA